MLQIQQRAKEWKGTQVKYGSGLFRIRGQHCQEISSHYPAVPATTHKTACLSETAANGSLSVTLHRPVSGKKYKLHST